MLLAKTESKGDAGQTSFTTRARYNAFGSLLEVEDPRHQTWRFSYADAQRLERAEDPLGSVVLYEQDALHRTHRITQPGGLETVLDYDANSNLIARTDPKGRRSRRKPPRGRARRA